jgi:hypothetical protein
MMQFRKRRRRAKGGDRRQLKELEAVEINA